MNYGDIVVLVILKLFVKNVIASFIPLIGK